MAQHTLQGLLQWTLALLESMAQQTRARISLHCLQVSHIFSSCISKLFFPCTSGTQSRPLDYCNTEQLTHSWLLPERELHHRVLHLLRSFLSDIHTGKKISLYIFKLQTIQCPVSPSLPDVCISLYLSQHRNKLIQFFFFFFFAQAKSSNGQNIKHCLMGCRKLHGNLHTEIHTQHLERVSLYLGSTEITMLLLVLFEVSGKKEKKQRDH